jgi:(1->4)-alpha-D-glucan 1-alpha-D-glucosylmutase
MSPGVVDTYQGGELWDLSLVDPDNRRPVAFETRRQRLAAITKNIVDPQLSFEERSQAVAAISQSWWSGDVKMLYVAQGLRLREREPDLLLRGSYHPLSVEGPKADHLIAFSREHHGKILVTIAARWFASLLSEPTALTDIKKSLSQTFVELSASKASASNPAKLTNVLTGATVNLEVANGVLRLNAGDCLDNLPAVWLIGDSR